MKQILVSKSTEVGAAYQQKELTAFCGGLFALLTNDAIPNYLSKLLKIREEELAASHFSAISTMIFGTAYNMLEAVARRDSERTSNSTTPLTCMSNDEKGKCRYIGGWALQKVSNSAKNYIDSNISSSSPAVRQNLRNIMMKFKVAESLKSSASTLQCSSQFKETLEIIQEKQFRMQGLTHITDDAYLFFLALEENRIKVLNHNRLNLLRGKVVADALKCIQNNEQLLGLWNHACEEAKSKVVTSNSKESTTFSGACYVIFKEVTERYMKMGAGQYLRDFRRDAKWQKTEAHRVKVMQRSEKNTLKKDQVSLDEIRSDTSEGKVSSHVMLRGLVEKHPNIFETRIYRNDDIKVLLKAYNIKPKGKKEDMAKQFAAAIHANTCMVNITHF